MVPTNGQKIRWGFWVAILALVGSLVGTSITTGRAFEKKADRSDLEDIRTECQAHRVHQARWEGEVSEHLNNIDASLIEIKSMLKEKE